MEESRKTSVSKADSIEAIGEFWDQTDFTDHDDGAPDVDCTVRCAVPVEPRLLTEVEAQAKRRGINAETLVNLWLQQKLSEAI